MASYLKEKLNPPSVEAVIPEIKKIMPKYITYEEASIMTIKKPVPTTSEELTAVNQFYEVIRKQNNEVLGSWMNQVIQAGTTTKDSSDQISKMTSSLNEGSIQANYLTNVLGITNANLGFVADKTNSSFALMKTTSSSAMDLMTSNQKIRQSTSLIFFVPLQ